MGWKRCKHLVGILLLFIDITLHAGIRGVGALWGLYRLFHETWDGRDQDCAGYRRLLCILKDLEGGRAALPRDWVFCARIHLHPLSSIEWLH